MLRFIVLLLLLANGLYFAWSQGYLASIGFAPAQQSEPHRQQTQLQPELLRPLSTTEAKRLETQAAAPAKTSECLQSALLDDKQSAAVRSAAASLPSEAWSLQERTEPARWIIYMGKYPGTDTLAKKKTELRQLGVDFEPLKNAALEPGLSLGSFESQQDATQELTQLTQRGVRTAKVVQEAPERKGQVLKLPAVDDTLKPQLEALRAAVALTVCKA